jgi:uncharacterized membrane protein
LIYGTLLSDNPTNAYFSVERANMAGQDERLQAIESRLQRIEEALKLDEAPTLEPTVSEPTETQPGIPEVTADVESSGGSPSADAAYDVKPPAGKLTEKIQLVEQLFSKRRPSQGSATTTLMAIGAALSFILAAAYFVGLVYNRGFLTPPMQLGIALMSGLGLIAAGLVFAQRDRRYASWLPAVGIVVLYLTVYAGHVHYKLIPDLAAIVIVAGISVGAIILGRRFDNGIYGMMAAAGVYVTPLLLGRVPTDLTGLMIYFSAWSLLFSFLSLQEANRATYLVALYMAMFCFDATWRMSGDPSWAGVAIYQFVQFAIFSVTAAVFSIRHKHPMTDTETIAHAFPLFFFYILEYILLHEHAPNIVAIAALVSVAVVWGLYAFARGRLSESASDSALGLVSTYCAAVTAHIVFFELTPTAYLPWAVLVLPVGLALMQTSLSLPRLAVVPILVVATIVCAWGLVVALTSDTMNLDVPVPNFALLVYAAMIYLAYFLLSKSEKNRSHLPLVLYAAHITFMVATIRIFDSGLLISVIWGAFAVILLVLALKRADRILGQSSLLVFTASAAKVLLFDMAHSPTLIRIGALLALGTSLYVGGWLYQNLALDTVNYHADPRINRQLQQIARLVREGRDNSEIVAHLIRTNVECLHPAGWDESMIAKIRSDFDLG